MRTLDQTMGKVRITAAWMISGLVACAAASKDAATPATSTPTTDRGPSTSGGAPPTPAMAAKGDFSRAQSDLETSLSTSTADCASACRALASLERAATHLCELSDPSECGEAKKRVDAARDRVTKACGACR